MGVIHLFHGWLRNRPRPMTINRIGTRNQNPTALPNGFSDSASFLNFPDPSNGAGLDRCREHPHGGKRRQTEASYCLPSERSCSLEPNSLPNVPHLDHSGYDEFRQRSTSARAPRPPAKAAGFACSVLIADLTGRSGQRSRISPGNPHAPVRAPVAQLSAEPAVAARLPPGLRTAASAARCAHPETRARRDARPTCPC